MVFSARLADAPTLPFFEREIKNAVLNAFEANECVALIGPRQIGKSAFAKKLAAELGGSVFKELHDPKQRDEVGDGTDFFAAHANELVVLDEIQYCPHLFPSLKAHIDRQRHEGRRGAGRFLLLGSASLDLQHEAAAALTGRCTELQMTGLLPTEIITKGGRTEDFLPQALAADAQGDVKTGADPHDDLERLWCRGGQPDSFMAPSDAISAKRRRDFLDNYLQHDLKALGFDIDSRTLTRCLRFLATMNGCEFKKETYQGALELKRIELDAAIGVLDRLLLVRILEPWSRNVRHQVTQKPTLYVRDTGLLHTLLDLNTAEAVRAYAQNGKSWEGFVIEAMIGAAINAEKFDGGYFFRRKDGQEELDFVMDRGDGVFWAVEIKLSPTESVKMRHVRAAEMIEAERRFFVHAGPNEFFAKQGGFEALSLMEMLKTIAED